MPDTGLERQRLLVLIASVVLLLVSGGGMYLIVVALKDVAMEFGWPRAVPSMAVSLLFIGSGIGGIFMGWILDRWGFGVPALVGSIMAGLGGILGGKIDSAWQLYLIYGLMFGLSGQGSVAAPAMANIARWYDKKRGMAVGIVASGQALAGIVWPPIFGLVMAAYGWRDMFLLFGIFALCIMVPMCIFVRHKPPPVVLPDAPDASGSGSSATSSPAPRPQPLSPFAITGILCAVIWGCCVSMGLPLGHLVSLVTDKGHPIQNAVEVLAAMLMAAFVSRAVILGLVSEQIGGLRALFLFSLVQTVTVSTLPLIDNLWVLYVMATVCGLGYGGIFPLYAVAIRDHLPIGDIGRRTGVIFMVGAMAMGFGSWMGGALFDLTESYVLPFVLGGAFNLANLAILAWLILRLRPWLPGRIAWGGAAT